MIAVGAVVTVGAAVAIPAGFKAGLWGVEQSSDTRSKLPPKTAQTTRQTLVDAQTESGKLGYGDAITVNGGLAGTLTALPAVGSAIHRGQALYHVNDTPVVLLYGSLPSYRALSDGTQGADIKQFEENLSALGYKGFTVDDKYSATTAAAVKKWQGDLGLAKTGTVDQGRIVYTSGPVRVDTQKAAVGDATQPGTALLTYTGSARVITVDLEVSDQRLARKDATVTVKLPDGKEVPGKIAGTKTVIDPGDGKADPTTKVEATVTVDDEKVLAGLDQASIQVGFTASQRENVLTVPVAALLTLAEGGYGVQVVQGAQTRIVKVETGLFAEGRVEISGEGLAEGMAVGMPS
jgi:multidrug efflux system membrane fusion protein